jgi:hypothetical protein
MRSLSLSLSLSDPSSAAMALCAAGGEEASVEILGFSTGLTPPQFQMVALVVLGVVLVMVAFMIVLVAPAGSPPASPPARSSSRAVPPSALSPTKTQTTITDGDGTDTGTHGRPDERTESGGSGDRP